MAKTVDEVIIKVKAEGTADIKETTKEINNLDAAAKRTGQTAGQTGQNVRNVAFQVQDLAVQIAGGTSAFVALGQQLPQLLGGFGAIGAVIGALAAVSIPLARVALGALGYDFRDLDERLADLEKSVQKLNEAQKNNLPTLQGLANQYGELTGAAKQFFELVQQSSAGAVRFQMIKSLQELQDRFVDVEGETKKLIEQFGEVGGLRATEGIESIGRTADRLKLGLTVEQASELARRFKSLDADRPKEAADTLNEIQRYLLSIAPAGSEAFGKLLPLLQQVEKLNKQFIDTANNVKAAGEALSRSSAERMITESVYSDEVSIARRSFDTIRALRAESAGKIAAFEREANSKTAKDQVDRTFEIAAFRLKTEDELTQKILDYRSQQNEVFRSASLTNEARARQLTLENQISDIQTKGLFDLQFNVRYAEDLLRIREQFRTTQISISEQERKGQITSEQALNLQAEALDLQNRQITNAQQARDRGVFEFVTRQSIDNMKKMVDEQINRIQKLGDTIQNVNRQTVSLGQQPRAIDTMGMSTLEKQVRDIVRTSEQGAIEARRAFAEGFNLEDGMSPEQASQLTAGLDQITQAYARLRDQQVNFALENYNTTTSFQYGWEEAFARFKESAMDNAKLAETAFTSMTRNFEDAIVRVATRGQFNFREMANSIIADIVRIQVRRSIAGFMGMDFFGGGGGEMAGAAVMGAPGFAQGGVIGANRPAIVGEKGPELFIPASSGNIIPNNQLQDGMAFGGTTVNYNISAVDAASFRQLVARDPQFIYNVTEAGRRSQPTRRLS